MRVYRICRRAFRALDGEGARINGGRWNTPGTPVVYCSETLSLAALEYLVHLDPDLAPNDLVALTLDVPAHALIRTLADSELPRRWREMREHPGCQTLGNEWARDGESLALRVPAAGIPGEYNVLINPRHALGSRVRVASERPFGFDARLLR